MVFNWFVYFFLNVPRLSIFIIVHYTQHKKCFMWIQFYYYNFNQSYNINQSILCPGWLEFCTPFSTLLRDWSFVMFDRKWSWSLSLRLVFPVLHKPPRATGTSRSAVRIRTDGFFISDGWLGSIYISFGDWANALECWRSPSLGLVIPGIAVSPGVTHSDSRIVFVTGTVVKPQQPPTKFLLYS